MGSTGFVSKIPIWMFREVTNIFGNQIPGREQYKHVLLGPAADSVEEVYFPAIRDAIDSGNWTRAVEQLEKTAAILHKASDKLVG